MNRPTILSLLTLAATLLAACDRAATSPAPTPAAPTAEAAPDPATRPIEPLRAIVETNRGTFTIDLFEQETPRTVASFCLLASDGFYDGQEFYGRSVVVRQIGRPVPAFTPGWTLPREFAPGKWFDRGGRVAATLVTNDDGSPAHGSGFFVTVKEQDRWNLVYPIFGDVVEGQEVVDAIGDGDTIRRVVIEGDPAPLWARYPDDVSQWRDALSKLDKSAVPQAAPR
ncbi:MAG: peptidylprolyl isomerase [Phycisphaerales bacterium]